MALFDNVFKDIGIDLGTANSLIYFVFHQPRHEVKVCFAVLHAV